ncbi:MULTISPECIES: hypothetical protein [Serratia]|uniref:hypothetical protein n=1 Tax=Serratia TaxID=613 RepID=UPI00313D8216
MAATLLELVIPASASIVVACGTVIWTVKSNRKLENEKLVATKREELVKSLEAFKYSTTKNLLLVFKEAEMSNEEHFESRVITESHINEITTPSALSSIKIICSLYFKDLIKHSKSIEEKNKKYNNECIELKNKIRETRINSLDGKSVNTNINKDEAVKKLSELLNETQSFIDIVINTQKYR